VPPATPLVFEATVRAGGCEAGHAARVRGVAFIVTGIVVIALGSLSA
jgi:sulfite exporter TauE/SafE